MFRAVFLRCFMVNAKRAESIHEASIHECSCAVANYRFNLAFDWPGTSQIRVKLLEICLWAHCIAQRLTVSGPAFGFEAEVEAQDPAGVDIYHSRQDRKSTRLNSSH